MKQADGFGEGPIRIVAAQHGAGRRALVALAEDHRGGAGVAQLRVVPRVGDECEIARPRLLDAGDADDVHVVRRAFEAAVEPFSNVAQLQGDLRIIH